MTTTSRPEPYEPTIDDTARWLANRYAAPIEANNARWAIGDAIRAAVAEEREACAKVALSKRNHKGRLVPYAQTIADEMRARPVAVATSAAAAHPGAAEPSKSD